MSIDLAAWKAAARAATVSGACAGVLSALALAWRGHRDAHDAAAPLNGPSQWLWGRHAPSVHGFSAKYTGLGIIVHHAAAFFWAVLYERLRARMGHAVPAAVATAAVANVVDYKLTPARLQPGYERQLSRRSLAWVYAAVALGFAASGLVRPRGRP